MPWAWICRSGAAPLEQAMPDASPLPVNRSAKQPLVNAPRVVLILIGLCLAVHAWRVAGGEEVQLWSLRMFAFIPAQVSGGIGEVWPYQRYWTFLSYAFVHGNGMHLAFNSLWMLIFGSFVARRLHPLRFLALSAVAAAAGAAAMLVSHWGEIVPVIGASGAVSGYMAAAVPLMYGGNIPLAAALRRETSQITPLRPAQLVSNRGALIFMAVWMLITLVTGASGFDEGIYGVGQQVRIAWEAHIGGFCGGLAAFYALDRR